MRFFRVFLTNQNRLADRRASISPEALPFVLSVLARGLLVLGLVALSALALPAPAKSESLSPQTLQASPSRESNATRVHVGETSDNAPSTKDDKSSGEENQRSFSAAGINSTAGIAALIVFVIGAALVASRRYGSREDKGHVLEDNESPHGSLAQELGFENQGR